MNNTLFFILASLLLSCAQQKSKQVPAQQQETGPVGGPCECCEGIYEDMPDFLRWETTVADESEPGERLYLSGTIRDRTGHPAPGIILYVYQTNAEGRYEPAEGQKGCARRHGKLRGWMETGENGQYGFYTILPGSYPGSREPRHIHVVVKERGMNEYWIDSFVFDHDPFLTKDQRGRLSGIGGSGIVRLQQKGDESWTGRRDIMLGENVANYK